MQNILDTFYKEVCLGESYYPPLLLLIKSKQVTKEEMLINEKELSLRKFF